MCMELRVGVVVVVVVVVVGWSDWDWAPFCILTPPLPQPHPVLPLRNTIIESFLEQCLNFGCKKFCSEFFFSLI